MTVLVFPVTLPQYLLNGVQRVPKSKVVRTQMQIAGVVKVRQNTTATKYVYSNCKMRLNDDELQEFMTFFNEDTGGSALSFEWQDPVDRTTRMFRFVGEPTPVTESLNNHVVEFSMETP